MQTVPSPLIDQLAALRHSSAQLGPAHALLVAMLLRLLGELEGMVRQWQERRAAPVRRRSLAGKGPIPRDWMLRGRPARGLRPTFPPPPQHPPARLVRAPPGMWERRERASPLQGLPL
jgi:hypothetical protein